MDTNRPFGNNPFADRTAHTPGDYGDVVDAELIVASTKKRTGLWISLGLGALFFSLVAVGIIVMIWLSVFAENPRLSPEMMTKTGAAKWEMFRAGFHSGEVDATDEEVEAIRSTVGNIMLLSSKDRFGSVRTMIDESGFMDQIERSGNVGLGMFSRIIIQEGFEDVTDGPAGFDHYKIAGIKRISSDEIVVFLYLWDDGDSRPTGMIWWMRSTDNDWKVIDWESMWRCQSEAAEYGILCEHQESTGVQNYYRWGTEYARAFECVENGEFDLAKRHMARVDKLVVHPELSPNVEISNSQVWYAIGDYEKALERIKLVTDPDNAPGTYLFSAEFLIELGRHQEALEDLDRFVEFLGPVPSALSLKAVCLDALGRADEALELRVGLAKSLPEFPGTMEKLHLMISRETIGKLGEFVFEMEDPVEQALKITRATHDPARTFVIEEMADVVDRLGTDQAAVQLIRSISKKMSYDYEAAISLLEQAIATGHNKYEKEIQNRYLDLMMAIGEPAKGYRNSLMKEDAFYYLTDGYDSGDYLFSASELQQLIAEHRDGFPESAWLDFYEARLLMENKENEEAIIILNRGLENSMKNGFQDSILSYHYSLTSAYLELNQPLKALRTAKKKVLAFTRIASFLLAKKDFENLAELVDEYRNTRTPLNTISSDEFQIDNRWVRFYQAVLEYENGQKAKAIQRVTTLVSDSSEAQKYTMRRTLNPWILESDQWQAYLRRMATTSDLDGNEVFEWFFDQFLELGSQDKLDQLFAVHEPTRLPDSVRKNWQYKRALTSKDDALLVKTLSTFNESDWDHVGYFSSMNYRIEWIRALMQLGQVAEAKRIGVALKEQTGVAAPLFRIAVKEGDPAAVRELLETQAEFNLNYSGLVSERELVPYLTSPKFAALRKDFPVPIPNNYDDPQVRWLYDGQLPDSIQIEKGLRLFFGDGFEFSELKRDPTEGPEMEALTWVGHSEKMAVVATLSRGELTSWGTVGIPKHNSVLSVYVQQPNEMSREITQQLTRQFYDRDCVGVYFSDTSTLLAAPFVNAGPATEGKFGGVERSETYLYFESAADSKPYWKKRRRVGQLVETMESDSNENFEVLASVALGGSTESYWFPVLRLDSKGEERRVIVDRNVVIQLFPSFQKNEPMLLELDQVEEWRIRKK